MWHFVQFLWNWFLNVTGSRNSATTNATYYGFWSGFGSDLGEVVIIGGLVHFARHANCGQKGCWRFGRHNWTDAKGVVHKLCRKHHPVVDGQITGAQIAEQHAARV
jgi:hypothetical protein